MQFGPLKPVGLDNPKTGTRPYAVVQLRTENAHGSCYNLVGFQTKLTYGEQKRVFRMIPGLEQAEFLRYGSLHRNTFINSPQLLRDTLQFKARGTLFFAGQLVFRNERWYHGVLHNETAFAVQRRLHLAGHTMVILPARVGA